jgi:hypothetical protein
MELKTSEITTSLRDQKLYEHLVAEMSYVIGKFREIWLLENAIVLPELESLEAKARWLTHEFSQYVSSRMVVNYPRREIDRLDEAGNRLSRIRNFADEEGEASVHFMQNLAKFCATLICDYMMALSKYRAESAHVQITDVEAFIQEKISQSGEFEGRQTGVVLGSQDIINLLDSSAYLSSSLYECYDAVKTFGTDSEVARDLLVFMIEKTVYLLTLYMDQGRVLPLGGKNSGEIALG